MATVEQFAEITRTVIADVGFDGFLPTALYPNRKSLVALDGVPLDADLQANVLAWAKKGAVEDEEFLVAFKVGPSSFKVLRRSTEGLEEGVFDVAGNA